MRKGYKIAILALLAMTVAGATAASLSWFDPATSVQPGSSLTGVSEGAYFAYGNGKPLNAATGDQPFGIETPRQLYNLAWLQYLGYIDDISGTESDETYFELAGDIDMTGWTLPPIGTESNPFMGHLNGNGYTISNLTVSDTRDQMTSIPDTVRDFTQPHILGLFGVVGPYYGSGKSYSSSTDAISNLMVSGITIKPQVTTALVGLAAGYVNGPISNVGVSDAIQQDSSVKASTLDLRAQVTPYAGGKNAAGTAFSKISEFGTVGYAESNYRKQAKKTVSTLKGYSRDTNDSLIAQDDGLVAKWGGSVNMKSMYNRVYDIGMNHTAKPSANTQYFRKNYDLDEGNDYSTATLNSNDLATTYHHVYNNVIRKSGETYNRKWGAFDFAPYSTSRFTSGDAAPIYLAGGHLAHYSIYGNRTFSRNGTLISNGSGSYLSITNESTNAVGAVSKTSETSTWTLPSAGSSGYISTVHPVITNGNRTDQTVYLRNNNGTLTTTTSTSATGITWEVKSVSGGIGISQGNYVLYHNGSTWALKTATREGNYIKYVGTYYDETYYMNTNGGSSFSPETNTPVTLWTLTNATDGSRTCTIKAGDYYLNPARESVSLSTTQGNAWRVSVSDSNYSFYYYDGSRYNYLYRSNSSWSMYRRNGTTNNYRKFTLEDGPINNYSAISTENGTFTKTYKYIVDDEYKMRYTDQYVTYFPLNVEDEENKNYNPTDTNTGYVIGGCNYNSNTDVSQTVGFGNANVGSIRLSHYTISYISNSYTQNAESINPANVKTVNASRNTVSLTDIESGTSKYMDAFDRYDKTIKTLITKSLKGSSTVYGLHFMDSEISKDYLASAVYARVNDDDKSNYQLPANSIDFNLKEPGKINFVAGAYYNSAAPDNFFSLHKIQRDASDQILFIDHVTGIYSDGVEDHSVVYALERTVRGVTTTYYTKPYAFDKKQNQYSLVWVEENNVGRWVIETEDGVKVPHVKDSLVSTLPAGYSLIFDTKRIEDPNTLSYKYLYYFEIPMNDGEFAIGAVQGASGGYLLYLDIGANASKINRTSITEHIQEITKTWSYPMGIALVATGTTPAAANAFNSFCIVVGSANKGQITLSRTGTTTGVATNSDATNDILIGFYHDSISVTDAAVNGKALDEATADSTSTTITERLTYYDYRTANESFTKIIITKKTIDEVDQTPTAEKYVYDEENDAWVVDNELTIFSDGGEVVTDLSTITIASAASNASVLEFKNIYLATGTITIGFGLEGGFDPVDEAQLFFVSGYAISVNYTDNSGQTGLTNRIEIVSYVSTYNTISITFKINGETVGSVGQIITVTLPTPSP